MSGMKQLIEQAIRTKLDESIPRFRISVPYDTDKISEITAPHKENDKILSKQMAYHKSNFKSQYPNSHKYLHYLAQRARDNIKLHLKHLKQKGPFEHDYKGSFAFSEVHEYEKELRTFNQDLDKFEQSIKTKKIFGDVYYERT